MTNHQQIAIINDPDTNESLRLDFLHMKKSMLILRALNHKLRQQILKLLDEKRKVTVTEIYIELRLEQSVTSQHLAILRRAGLVSAIREGKFIYYTINYKRVKEVNAFVEQLVG
ncbi:helix-turn-helix transcriptional regulator [Panacibacter ginsenosidivorans]|uniref:Helix-turn-helix transcriptional regulator n=1 Tax=Panacibacter ginsenosidivorans TaxID=1813871 RepID=A0A5B8V8R0_9BACT|nr:metalloregulator ArsR/SmtB family transcription factor [Panacibacter ginsenosidivorans]QEC67794.1 helix-turn-helix transcriptional regulator [Panacibacter ginsenosidivorans]